MEKYFKIKGSKLQNKPTGIDFLMPIGFKNLKNLKQFKLFDFVSRFGAKIAINPKITIPIV